MGLCVSPEGNRSQLHNSTDSVSVITVQEIVCVKNWKICISRVVRVPDKAVLLMSRVYGRTQSDGEDELWSLHNNRSCGVSYN